MALYPRYTLEIGNKNGTWCPTRWDLTIGKARSYCKRPGQRFRIMAEDGGEIQEIWMDGTRIWSTDERVDLRYWSPWRQELAFETLKAAGVVYGR